jgi:ATP-dependent Clp protease, protease subunit
MPAIALTRPSPHKAQMDILGYIGGWTSNAEAISAALDGLTDQDEIEVRINSLGGLLHEGLAMHNYLKASPARVRVTIMGVAGSAASVVAMAGDEVVIYENALMMIHAARMVDEDGEIDESDEAKAGVKAFNATLIATYAAKSGQTAESIADKLKGDTWLTAAEAVEMGFADRIEPIKADTAAPENRFLALASALGIPSEKLATRPLATVRPEPVEGQPAPVRPEPVSTVRPELVEGQPAGLMSLIQAHATAQGLAEFAGAFALDARLQTEAHVQAAIAEAAEIKALGELVSLPEAAAQMIRSRKDLQTARATLAATLAATAEAQPTDGLPPSTPSAAAKSGTAAWDAFLAAQKAPQ